MSWWDKNKQKKEKKQHQEQQVKMLQNIATLSRFAKAGLLFIDMKERKVVISTTLSSLFLGDKTKWTNFLGNVQMWFVYKVSQLNWHQLFLKEELKAVREVKKKYPFLTKPQEVEIRHQARAKIDVEALEPPKIEPFDFILSTDISNGKEPEIFAVGRYENGEFDMVTFDEVKANQDNN